MIASIFTLNASPTQTALFLRNRKMELGRWGKKMCSAEGLSVFKTITYHSRDENICISKVFCASRDTPAPLSHLLHQTVSLDFIILLCRLCFCHILKGIIFLCVHTLSFECHDLCSSTSGTKGQTQRAVWPQWGQQEGASLPQGPKRVRQQARRKFLHGTALSWCWSTEVNDELPTLFLMVI